MSKKYLRGSLSCITVAVAVGAAPCLGAAADNVADQSKTLDEIVVTAQKREERLQDVPVPVSVLNTAELVQNDQFSLSDYSSTVPGLIYADDGTGGGGGRGGSLSIRGLSAIGGNPTVAILIDDVPYGASTYLQFGTVPDVDPDDLARIEVLRGPQGTLYGARGPPSGSADLFGS